MTIPTSTSLPRRNQWLGTTTNTEPLPPRRGAEHVGAYGVAWDFGPPGILSVGPTVAAHALFAAISLPLSVVGLASTTWADWPVLLRVFLGVVGVAGTLLSALLVLWPFVFAAAFRERLLLRDGHLHLARGVGPFRRLGHLGPASAFTIRTVQRKVSLRMALFEPNYLGGHHNTRLALFRTGEATPTAQVGSWLDAEVARIAHDRITRAIIASKETPGSQTTSEPSPLGWTSAGIGSRVLVWWRARVADPAPLLFDLAAILGFALAAWLPDITPSPVPALKAAYPVAAVVFFVTLAMRLRHTGPTHGLSPALGRPLGTAFGLALTTITLVVGFAIGPILEAWWSNDDRQTSLELIAVCLTLTATTAIFVGRMAFRRAGQAPTSESGPVDSAVNLAFLASLILLTWVHESWAWTMVEDGRRGLGPLSLALVPTSTALLVWPARLFFQLETPFDDGPRWGFVWLVASFAFFALTGVH